MRYLFTGNNSFLIKDAVKKWKNQFIEKYGDFNLVHIKDLNENDLSFLADNLLSSSFLSEKKLIILDLINELNKDLSDFLIDKINSLPENNILLISYPNPDKRQKLFKELKNNCETKEFNIQNENDTYSIIKNKYDGLIEESAIKKLISYKSNNIEKITSEIEKLLIIKNKIKLDDIIEYVIPELEESIFQVIDNILNLKINLAIKDIEIILNQTNIYAFYNNLLANLRINVFISKLKKENIPNNEIIKILNLGNRSFLLNKNYKISSSKLSSLYTRLIDIDKKMKTGELIGSEENDFKLELEKELIKAI